MQTPAAREQRRAAARLRRAGGPLERLAGDVGRDAALRAALAAAALRLIEARGVRPAEAAALALPGEVLDPASAEAAAPIAAELAGWPPDPADPHALGDLYEQLCAPADRRSRGQAYTPAPIAAELAARTVGRALAEGAAGLALCDPAMGCGRFLLAALAHGPAARAALAGGLRGVELDPLAAAVARAQVGLALLPEAGAVPDLRARLAAGDSLAEPPPAPLAGALDIVIGNPPYVDAERMAREDPARRRALAARFRAARGSWDLFVVFVELGLGLVRPGGRLAMLVPNRLLGAAYAAGARALLAEQRVEALLDYSRAGALADSAYPVAFVARRAPPAGPGAQVEVRVYEAGEGGAPRLARQRTCPAAELGDPARGWSHLAEAPAPAAPRGARALGDIARVAEAATVAEAYAIAELLAEHPPGAPLAGLLRLVNTGTIDPYEALWGVRPARYLGRSILRPVAAVAGLAAVAPRRVPDGRPRLIVAGLGRRLEALADERGELLPGKSTVVVAPAAGDVWALLGLLNSAAASRRYRELHGGLALRGGHLRVGAPQLARLPVPAELPEELGRLARERAAAPPEERPRLDARIDELAERLYWPGDR